VSKPRLSLWGELILSRSVVDELMISGILGVYFLAAPLGSLVDKYGPRM
jgi:hypothetical protein